MRSYLENRTGLFYLIVWLLFCNDYNYEVPHFDVNFKFRFTKYDKSFFVMKPAAEKIFTEATTWISPFPQNSK